MPTYAGADGARLHYDDDALHRDTAVELAPIIVLAGGAALHPDYLGDLAGIADEQRLIVVHLRGVGRSPLPDVVELASFWRQADDIESLRVHLGLERVLLLAHSAGTRLAIGYATQYAERVAGLVLVTPPAGYLVDVQSDAEAILAKRRGDSAFDAAEAAWASGPTEIDDAAFNAWRHEVAPLGYASWGETERAHSQIGRTSYAANRAFFSVEPPDDLDARLAGVTAPVLVIGGAEDCGTGVAPVVALAKLFPAGQVVVLERCGHHPWVEQPAAFRDVVDGFLRDRLSQVRRTVGG